MKRLAAVYRYAPSGELEDASSWAGREVVRVPVPARVPFGSTAVPVPAFAVYRLHLFASDSLSRGWYVGLYLLDGEQPTEDDQRALDDAW